ncbi:MAG: hypothetical protein R3C53_18555 [Pirellulaceae bacterium]
MSNWRESNSGGGKKKQPKLKSPKPVQLGNAPRPQPAGGWRGKSKGKVAAGTTSNTPARSWTGAAPGTEAMGGAAIRRWLIIGVLFVLASVLSIYFLREAFFKPRPLPMFVFSVGDHESSPELLENPFGNSQREQLQSINRVNLFAQAVTQSDNDNALASLSSPTWIEKFESIRSKAIQPGGPSKRFACIYVCSYAAFTDDDQLVIYPQNTSPFGGPAGVKLEDLLASAASSVPRGTFAWVVLDLQLPPVIANLGDLDPQWESAARKAISQLDEDLQKRLLVTLPCGNGEQNWLAPEYSSSFFGFFFRQLLEGRSANTNILMPNLTIEKFREYLSDRVANDVSNRRFARQTPVWLPEENLEQRVSQLQVLTVGRQQDEVLPKPNIEAAQLAVIDELWRGVSGKYSRAYRWDPLGYAKIESQLLALEEVALNQPGSFSKAKQLVDLAIAELRIPEANLDVSLIEDVTRNRYFHGPSDRFDAIERFNT